MPTRTTDLLDFSTSAPADNQIPVYDAGTGLWTPEDAPTAPANLSDMLDCDITAPADGQVLTFVAASGKWEARASSLTTIYLRDLADVDPDSAVDGDVIAYDASEGKFLPKTVDEVIAAHNHDTDYISIIGTPAANHFPYQTAGGELVDSTYDAADFAAAGHNHAGVYEPAIAAGTTGQFWRGDKTWQAVPEGGEVYIYPEDYGAVGDGVTDDYQAFVDMFDDIKTGGAYSGTTRRTVILNPTDYYRISTRTDATNVFLVPETAGLAMIGNGKEVQTFVYDGPAATNFFNFAGGSQAVHLSNMYISGGEGTDLANYPITNIFYLDNVNYCTFENMTIDRCTGYGIGGFNWYTKMDHVEVTRCDIGVGPVSTTVLCQHVYANNCRIGFEVECWYGVYIGCACDWADVMFDLDEPWSVAIVGCGCEKPLQAMEGRALEMSVQGFTFDQTDVLGEFTFTSGGTYEIKVGDTITGATSGETAVVARVHLTGGTWAGGDAAGTIRVTGTPSGAFQAENLNVGANLNVATIAGDIANRESSFALDQTKGRITGLYGKCETTYWFDCNDTCPDLIIDEPDSFTGSFKSFIKDYVSPSYIMVPQVTGYPYSKDYNQTSKALSLFATVHGIDLSHHNSRMTHEILYADGTLTLTSTLTMQKIHGNGTLIFRNENTVQGPIVTFNPSSGVGMSLQDIDVPIVFRNMYFKLNQDTYMFEIRRCREVRFENCKFENTSGAGGYPFDIDKYSKVILDKDTMDDMVTATWNGLDNGRMWHSIEFRDYTAAPVAGLFDTGHRIWFQTPSAGAYLGCACTSGGVPGTWKGLGLVEA